MSQTTELTYVGNGRFLVGIPATDLTHMSLATLAETRGVKPDTLRAKLLASGLYAESKVKPPEK